jgi:hypothetical protein
MGEWLDGISFELRSVTFVVYRTTRNKKVAPWENFFELCGMSKQPMSIRLDAHQQAMLAKVSAQSGVAKQELIRIALNDFLNRLEQGERIVVERVIALRDESESGQAGAGVKTSRKGGGA